METRDQEIENQLRTTLSAPFSSSCCGGKKVDRKKFIPSIGPNEFSAVRSTPVERVQTVQSDSFLVFHEFAYESDIQLQTFKFNDLSSDWRWFQWSIPS